MKWSNQSIIDNIEMRRLAHMAYESAFRAFLSMYAEDEREMSHPIRPSAYGCSNLENKMIWNIWIERYVDDK